MMHAPRLPLRRSRPFLTKREKTLMRSHVRTKQALRLAFACLFVCVLATDTLAGWTTSGSKIIAPSGAEFRISGINWYGFETSGNVAKGLFAHDYTYIIDAIGQD